MKLSQETWELLSPKFVQCLRKYRFQDFLHDLVAGVTVGLVALPLAMAFAIASGAVPEAGLYCAIVAGFLASALGGSRFQISGPTGAFVVVVAGIIAKFGMDGLFLCTVMAGVMLIILGATGLGSAIEFIPRSVVIGFTNGIAILIASTQIKDFFGLRIASLPSNFLERMRAYAEYGSSWQASALAISVGALFLISAIRRFYPRVPGTVLALVAGTIVCWWMKLPVETIADRFGGIPSGFPAFRMPVFRLDLVETLLPSAITVAMLGAIESLLSAVVADRMGGGKHNPNVELVAQGVANLVSPFAGGLPATGAIARTATSIRSGARTPVAGMIHALTLLAILLFAAPLAKHIPLCILSAILMIVAYNMGEWHEIKAILKLSWADISVWVVTFALTVFADLTVAVESGMILAALMYIRKVTHTTTVSRVTPEYIEAGREHSLQLQEIPDGVAIYRIHGPFLFGSTDKLEGILEDLSKLPPVIILRLRNMTAIDGTGLKALEELTDQLHSAGKQLLLCGAREQPKRLIQHAEFQRHIGAENIFPNVQAALHRAKELVREKQLPAMHH